MAKLPKQSNNQSKITAQSYKLGCIHTGFYEITLLSTNSFIILPVIRVPFMDFF